MDLNKGGYVFLSHSHQDIQKVRKIRNAMEEAGFEPLCFYLKCLSDEDEIEGLIKREIDAREWFVYLDSPNARASSWVRKEREYIGSIGNKQIVTIDLESGMTLEETSDRLIRGLRVCIISHTADRLLAEEFGRLFEDKDLQVSVSITDSPEKPINENGAGCIVPLLSRKGLSSGDLDSLLSNVKREQAIIIPVLAGDYASPVPGSGYSHVYFLRNPDSGSLREEIVRRIETDMTHDLRKAFSEARSHREIEAYYLNNQDDQEAERLAQEAHDRLDEARRIREDIEEQIERGKMKMTDELKKYLDSLY